MDAKELKRVLESLKDSDVNELLLETPDYKLTVKRGAPQVAYTAPAAAAPTPYAETPAAAAPEPTPAAPTAAPAAAPKTNLTEVTAPIVGTFYASPSPEAGVFISVGDRVQAGQVLCIIEAMKLMNEIEAESAGVVREILVKNEEPVEYGQTLFRLEPV